MTETYQDWMSRMLSGRKDQPLAEGETVSTSRSVPVKVVELARVDRQNYVAEVGRRGDDLIFHFFVSTRNPEAFLSLLHEVFLKVFKFPERIQVTHEPELEAFTGIAKSFGQGLAVSLIPRIFDSLDEKLV